MKAIVCHLSGPKGPRTTLALLDGISAAIVTNSWRAGNTNDPKHKWCKETYAAYRAIIEQLEKYWVLAIVHTSTRSTISPFIILDLVPCGINSFDLICRQVCPGTNKPAILIVSTGLFLPKLLPSWHIG
jgi:hypothetical protein